MPGDHQGSGGDAVSRGSSRGHCQVLLQGRGSYYSLKADQVHFHNSRHLCKFPGAASHGAPCPLKGTEGLSILLWKKSL